MWVEEEEDKLTVATASFPAENSSLLDLVEILNSAKSTLAYPETFHNK